MLEARPPTIVSVGVGNAIAPDIAASAGIPKKNTAICSDAEMDMPKSFVTASGEGLSTFLYPGSDRIANQLIHRTQKNRAGDQRVGEPYEEAGYNKDYGFI